MLGVELSVSSARAADIHPIGKLAGRWAGGGTLVPTYGRNEQFRCIVTYAVEDALFSGDVLFEGSVGRTDLPGGDWAVLSRSIESLLDRYPDEQRVFPGHMGLTTLGRERATNPFLQELA